MPPLLKKLLPVALAVIAAIAIFFAGAYSSARSTGKILTSQLGLRDLNDLTTTHTVLRELDAGRAESARGLLILQEDGHLMSLEMLAPYLSDDMARSACKIMRDVAKRRADNAAGYAPSESTSDPEVRRIVAATLENPAACTRIQ
ncbi:MAG: hypothetical protein JSR36_00835 [Proteobacteria bacterium]|nr:hypothetical protein [Pseudomonadota bacterium]